MDASFIELNCISSSDLPVALHRGSNCGLIGNAQDITFLDRPNITACGRDGRPDKTIHGSRQSSFFDSHRLILSVMCRLCLFLCHFSSVFLARLLLRAYLPKIAIGRNRKTIKYGHDEPFKIKASNMVCTPVLFSLYQTEYRCRCQSPSFNLYRLRHRQLFPEDVTSARFRLANRPFPVKQSWIREPTTDACGFFSIVM